MGTNYYASTGACPHCGHAGHVIHIGKNSAGWAFSLRIYPDNEQGLPTNFNEWESYLHEPGVTIADEYGDTVEVGALLELIQHKIPHPCAPLDPTPGGEFDPEIGLYRHTSQIRSGNGTYDYITGDFC